MDISRFGMDTMTLAGTLDDKLRAISSAGFAHTILWAKDLVGAPDGIDAASRRVRESGVRMGGFQVLRDFEGLSGHLFEYKLDIAKSMLKMMHAVGCNLLLVCSSTSPHATGDIEKIAQDLATLATLATPLGIRIGYEALSWGRWINEYPTAWKAIELADRDNVGLVLDSFHIHARETPLHYLEDVPPGKVYLVQLSDTMWDYMAAVDELIETARHHRVFPGEGAHSAAVVDLVRQMDRAGYAGDFSFAVANDDYLQCPVPMITGRARKAAEWLGREVARDSGRS